MHLFKKIISISLSPNTNSKDLFLAIKLLLAPRQWKRGGFEKKIIQDLSKKTTLQYITTVNSGRGGLYLILQALGIGAGDEVLLQAFTCVAVPGPVLWIGARPVYVDIQKDSYTMDPADLEKKITKKSKAVIVQHTFGLAANIEAIVEIAKRYHLFVIEDCAHALGTRYQEKPVGIFGDVAFFSFGRDKVLSSVYGGAIGTNDPSLAKKIAELGAHLPYPSYPWIVQQLLHPIVFSIAIPLYPIFKIGPLLIFLAQHLALVSYAVTTAEKQGGKQPGMPKKLPNALARLASLQFDRLDAMNDHRRRIAAVYDRELDRLPITKPNTDHGCIYLRYVIQVANPEKIYKKAKKEGIYLGDWYHTPVAPIDVNLPLVQYTKGECPNAEKITKKVINLPTHPRMTLLDAEKVVQNIQKSIRTI